LNDPAHSHGKNAFTLLELIVVLAGLGILASLAIPNFIRWLDEAKIDQAKALLNSAASECIQMYRENDEAGLLQKPTILTREPLPSGYQFKEGADTCSYIEIEDPSDPESRLIDLGIQVYDPETEKIQVRKWSQFKNPDSEYACRSWGSCGEGAGVADLKAKIQCKADFDAAKGAREKELNTWKIDPQKNSGLYSAAAISVCNYSSPAISEWFFKGISLGASPEGETKYKAEVTKACGIERTNAVETAKSKTEGLFQYNGSSPECSVTTYICSGVDVGSSKDSYDACKAAERRKTCEAAEERWISRGVNGEFEEQGCDVKYLCNGQTSTSKSWFEDTCKSKTPDTPDCGEPIATACYRESNYKNLACSNWARCMGYIK